MDFRTCHVTSYLMSNFVGHLVMTKLGCNVPTRKPQKLSPNALLSMAVETLNNHSLTDTSNVKKCAFTTIKKKDICNRYLFDYTNFGIHNIE